MQPTGEPNNVSLAAEWRSFKKATVSERINGGQFWGYSIVQVGYDGTFA